MLGTVWLILSAMTFGAVMETTGMLQRIAKAILGAVRGTGSLIAATLCTSIGMNIIASDQYMAIVLPGRMFRAEFARRGLAPQNLSRTLEDAGTLTSPLVPVEHLRRVHVPDAGRRDGHLSAVRLLQSDQSNRRRDLRLHRIHHRQNDRSRRR